MSAAEAELLNAIISGNATESQETEIREAVASWLSEHPEAINVDISVVSKPGEVIIDDTLSIADAAADAKATGDAIANVNGRLQQYEASTAQTVNLISTGDATYSKTGAKGRFEQILTGYVYRASPSLDVGHQPTSVRASDSYALKIPCDGIEQITYPVFKTSTNLGCIFVNSDGNVIETHYVTTDVTSGSPRTVDVPADAEWFGLSITASIETTDWTLSLKSSKNMDDLYDSVNVSQRRINLFYGDTVTKTDRHEMYSTGKLYSANNLVIGTTKASEVVSATSSGAFAVKVSMTDVKRIKYPVFKTSSNYISFICDADDTVIWRHYERDAATGTMKEIEVPETAAYMVLSISATLSAMDWSYTLYSTTVEKVVSPFKDENRNLCLAGIKTDILTNKIPYHRGFLFHKLQNNDDNSLWYGTNLVNAKMIGTVNFNPTLMRFAISPTDGRIIAVQRDTRNGIWVWDGEETTHITGFTEDPMAWLYNSGVDFILDSNNVEHCVFAEYNGSPTSGIVYKVWRGTYPYTSLSDWEVVHSMPFGAGNTAIMHYHMVRRDPWTNVLYLTSGDNNPQCNWWYSTDAGATWTLLTSGSTSDWPDQTLRTINFVFTKDWIYWATDHGTNHILCRIARDRNGIIDITTREKLADLPDGYATNSVCYVESPRGIFMYDRVDTGYNSQYGDPVTFKFWDLTENILKDIVTLPLTSATWGGSRGKCYLNYTNSKQPYPCMGFSIDTPCIFDLVCDNPSNIGTIAYDVGSRTVRTVDY